MRVCGLVADLDGSGFYRFLSPAKELRRRGIACYVHPYEEVPPKPGEDYRLHYDVDADHDADVWWFQRRMELAMPALIRQLQSNGRVCVVETDDCYGAIPDYNPAFWGTHPIRSRQVNRDNFHRSLAAADVVVVSTPALADFYQRFNPNVVVLPNYLDWSMWADLEPVERDRIRIGWTGVSGWRGPDLHVLRGLIRPFLDRHPEVDFFAAGDPKVLDILDIPEGRGFSVGQWRFPETPRWTSKIDIGLIPLQLNTFNQCKSHLKGLEYNAARVPYVASPSDPYLAYTEDGVNGFVARRPRHWLARLEELVSDESLRRAMGEKAREKAHANRIDAHGDEWETFVRGLVREEVAA